MFQFKRKDAYKISVRKKVLLTEKGIANFLCKTFTYIDYSLFIEQRANSANGALKLLNIKSFLVTALF